MDTDARTPAAVGRTLGVRYATMPPGPMASVSIGQSDIYPYYFKVWTSSKTTFLNNDEFEHPVHLMSGRLDLAFVILYLNPLIILTLSGALLRGSSGTDAAEFQVEGLPAVPTLSVFASPHFAPFRRDARRFRAPRKR